MSLAKRFIQFYRPHLKLFSIDMVCALIVATFDLIFPVISKIFINDFIPNGNMRSISIYTIVLLILYLIRTICQYIMSFWGHVMGARIETDMRSTLYRHLHTLPFTFYDENKTGQIMSRVVGDLRESGELAHHGPEDLFISLLMLIGSFVALMLINWQLTLIIFIVITLLIWFSLSRRTNMMKSFKEVRKSHAEINAKLESSISGIRLCKSFANEDFEIEQFETQNNRYKHSWTDAYKLLGEYSAGNEFLIEILGVLVISLGGYLVYNGEMNFGDLVAFLLYTSFFVKPIRRLVQFTQQYQSGIAGFQRFVEMMDIKTSIVERPDAIPIENLKGEINFSKVEFQYSPSENPILTNFNLNIPSGQMLALVGPSGVGKTTLTNLIPRFYEIQKGMITIDDYDIKSLTLESLRKNIGFVQQDVFIFYGTIKDNIEYGKPTASLEEIISAAKQAKIHEFIMSLNEGYDSLVGERGVKLSMGQKQRIAIARVFLKNPPILILDEATSSLDNITELKIQEAIEELAKKRTTIVIAHRLSTIQNAHEIIVLTDEGVSESGNHEQLLALNGMYAQLYNAQFKGFIPDEI